MDNLQRLTGSTLLLLTIIVMTACGSRADTPVTAPPGDFDPVGTLPVFEDEPSVDGAFIWDTASVDSIDVAVSNSLPATVRVTFAGMLTEDCASVGEVLQVRDGSTFFINVGSVKPADVPCAPAQVPYSQSVNLNVVDLPAGEYTVNVNGLVKTFTFATENSDPRGDLVLGLAFIETVDIRSENTESGRVEFDIRGNLPTPCSTLAGVNQTLLNTDQVVITVEWQAFDKEPCSSELKPFQITVVLELDLTSGTFPLIINGYEGELTVP